MNRKLLSLLLMVGLFVSSTVFGDTIVKFDLGGTGSGDVEYVGGVFRTVDDGNAGTPGAQNTGVDYTGFLDGVIADILVGASMTIDNVIANGGATVLAGVIIQVTAGGTMNIWSDTGTLLLSGILGDGAITGSTGGTTGSFFNTTVMNYTAGSLLSFVSPTPAGISLGLTDIFGATGPGMNVAFDAQTQQNVLGNFRADASGLLTGASVPEPTSMLLLGSAILGGIASRKKKIA